MAMATWNGAVLAESDHTIMVEGNRYFPPEAVNTEYFDASSEHSTCPWKGVANFLDVTVDGQSNRAAAWIYPSPSPAAADIKDHVAFWHGVAVQG